MGRGRQFAFQFCYLALVVLLAVLAISSLFSLDRPLALSGPLGFAIMWISFLPVRLFRLWQAARRSEPSMLRDPAVTVTLHEPVIERAVAALMGVGLLAFGGLSLIDDAQSDVPTYLWVIVAAMGAYFIILTLAKRRAQLRLSPAGLDWSQIAPSLVPWGDITSSTVRSFAVVSSLAVFEVTEAGKYFPRGRKRQCKKFGIMAWQFGLDAQALSDAIDLRRSAYAAPSTAPA